MAESLPRRPIIASYAPARIVTAPRAHRFDTLRAYVTMRCASRPRQKHLRNKAFAHPHHAKSTAIPKRARLARKSTCRLRAGRRRHDQCRWPPPRDRAVVHVLDRQRRRSDADVRDPAAARARFETGRGPDRLDFRRLGDALGFLVGLLGRAQRHLGQASGSAHRTCGVRHFDLGVCQRLAVRPLGPSCADDDLCSAHR